jgi:hypothetical protein
MDNSQKYQVYLNGAGVGEIINRFDAPKKMEALFETALALADMLKRLEWVKCPGHEDILFCPHCGALQMYGHAKGCELAALLKGLEVENANKI